jgi:hypothetical protein
MTAEHHCSTFFLVRINHCTGRRGRPKPNTVGRQRPYQAAGDREGPARSPQARSGSRRENSRLLCTTVPEWALGRLLTSWTAQQSAPGTHSGQVHMNHQAGGLAAGILAPEGTHRRRTHCPTSKPCRQNLIQYPMLHVLQPPWPRRTPRASLAVVRHPAVRPPIQKSDLH